MLLDSQLELDELAHQREQSAQRRRSVCSGPLSTSRCQPCHIDTALVRRARMKWTGAGAGTSDGLTVW